MLQHALYMIAVGKRALLPTRVTTFPQVDAHELTIIVIDQVFKNGHIVSHLTSGIR